MYLENIRSEELRDIFYGAITRYQDTPWLALEGYLRYNRLLKAIEWGGALRDMLLLESHGVITEDSETIRQMVLELCGERAHYFDIYAAKVITAKYREKYPELFQ